MGWEEEGEDESPRNNEGEGGLLGRLLRRARRAEGGGVIEALTQSIWLAVPKRKVRAVEAHARCGDPVGGRVEIAAPLVLELTRGPLPLVCRNPTAASGKGR